MKNPSTYKKNDSGHCSVSAACGIQLEDGHDKSLGFLLYQSVCFCKKSLMYKIVLTH